ncbi:MFS transporter [Patescibacteria group bacterium]|nr:MFS transporter [Patescibacteria group bacterium]
MKKRKKGLKINKNLFNLFLLSQLHTIGQSLVGIFGVIFIYEKYNFSLELALIYYFLFHLVAFLVIPIGSIFINKFGIKKSIILGKILLLIFYLMYIFFQPYNIFFILSLFLVGSFGTAFYWVPYHVNFAKLTDKNSRGTQIGMLGSMMAIISIVIPVSAALIITKLGYNYLFITTAIFYLLSIIPILGIDHANENYSFKYFETFSKLFDEKYRKDFLIYILEGAESIISAIIWPIMIFLLLNKQYEAVGITTSLIVLGTVVLNILLGRATDKFEKNKMIKIASFLNAIGWFLKIFVHTAFDIFITSVYHDFSRIFLKVPYQAFYYEKWADNGHFVDEFTVVREEGLRIGKMIMAAFILLMIIVFKIDIKYILIFGILIFYLLGVIIQDKSNLLRLKGGVIIKS